MTLASLKEVAIGDLGWTLERWEHATLTELNMAIRGYWRTWERNIAWLMREIVYTEIVGNPYIDKAGKPAKSKDVFKIQDDDLKNELAETKKVSPEELEEARLLLIGLRDGTTRQANS